MEVSFRASETARHCVFASVSVRRIIHGILAPSGIGTASRQRMGVVITHRSSHFARRSIIE
jgi:hypothetical protein